MAVTHKPEEIEALADLQTRLSAQLQKIGRLHDAEVCRDAEHALRSFAALLREWEMEERLLGSKWYLRKHSDGYYWKLGDGYAYRHVVADTRPEAARLALEHMQRTEQPLEGDR